MPNGVTKRIVVIKDIPSNVIEEAILILKGEPGQKEPAKPKGRQPGKAAVDNGYLLKEAQIIINDYMREHNSGTVSGRGLKLPERLRQSKLLVNTAINIALLGSIALFIFMITKLM